MEGLSARLECIERPGIERKAATAVLPVDAGFLEHHAGTELVVNALDERNGAALAVDHAHPHGIARPPARAPRRGPAPVDAGGEFAHVIALEQIARIDRHVSGIGDVAVAHAERLLGRFHAQVHVIGAGRTRFADFEFVEYAEDQQRHQALRRRRHVVAACRRCARAPAGRRAAPGVQRGRPPRADCRRAPDPSRSSGASSPR